MGFAGADFIVEASILNAPALVWYGFCAGVVGADETVADGVVAAGD